MNLLEQYKYTDKVISLETINELNIPVILHYFYYAWLLTITEDYRFAIPNNDVITAYEDLIFPEIYTENYINLREKAILAIEKLEENTSYLKEFIKFLLNYKYVNQDKRDLTKLWEQVITSDIFVILKTFVRLDLRREVNILSWRTDLEYIDYENRKILFEFKIAKKSPPSPPLEGGISSKEEIPNYVEKKLEEARKQAEKYEWYDRKYVIVVDLENVDVFVEEFYWE